MNRQYERERERESEKEREGGRETTLVWDDRSGVTMFSTTQTHDPSNAQ